jgi:hypothetical protein
MLALVVSLPGTPADAGIDKAPMCRDGRFLMPGDGLVVGDGVPPVEAVELDDGRITIAPLGDPGKVKLRRTRKGTKVKALWGKRSGFGAKVRLNGVIDPSCTQLRAKLRSGKLDLRADVAAVLSTCGDGIIDEADGEQCEPPATETCDGSCQPLCDGGPCVCAGSELACDGTCVDVNTDPDNCGHCGTVCPGGPHAPPTCIGGGCAFRCEEGFGDCDEDHATGCEVDVTGDPTNCGRCDLICPASAAACCDSA